MSPKPELGGSTLDVERGRHSSDTLGTTMEPSSFSQKMISWVRTSNKEHGPPPDGGLEAWSQIIWSHFTVCSTWGYVTTFGVFQTHYNQMLSESPSAISWIGSVQVFPPFLHCNFFRASVRCRILQTCLGYWSSPRSDRDFYDFIVFNLLATVPVARPLPGYRERAYVLSHALFDTDIFLKASVLGYWCYCCWFQYRGPRVPRRHGATTSANRIPMDHACSWLLEPVDASSLFHFP